MAWQIALYNNFTYSVAVMVLISTVIYDTKRMYVVAFSMIAIVGLILTFLASAPNWIIPTNTILLTLCFFKPAKRFRDSFVALRRTFYFCLTVSTLTWSFIATLSIMLIAPLWLNTDSYNLFMGATLIIVALVVKIVKGSMGWCKQLNDNGYAIALEIVVLSFFSFILPTYLPYDKGRRYQSIGIICTLIYDGTCNRGGYCKKDE